jgi:hypothetical protein
MLSILLVDLIRLIIIFAVNQALKENSKVKVRRKMRIINKFAFLA